MFDLMSKILDEIRKAIKASGKSRYRLSKDTSIPQSQLSRLMTGEKALSIESLEKLIKALGLEIIIRPKTTKKRKVKYGKRE
ncbi:MAG: helix-turn-helix transcriptional regulator [Sedimentisphaerales bacterium]|jgi:transcriptional regulator with XRE-family HTH domain